MDSREAWALFEKTGRVSDYILYKQLMNQQLSLEGERPDADQNSGDRHPGSLGG